MWNRISITATVAILASTAANAEVQWRLGANLASLHVKATTEFNQFNPGLYLSVAFRPEYSFQYGVQFGAYLNSYNERTIYGLTFANWRLLKLNGSELRIGVAAGFFEYPSMAKKAEKIGWPTINNYILAFGPTLTLRMKNGVDVSLAYIPVQTAATSGIITLQTSIAFGR